MSEAARPATASRALHIPLWDEYGQAQRFAVVLALFALAAALPRALVGEGLVAAITFAFGAALLGLCLASDRGGPRWLLGAGTPACMSVAALVLLGVTGGNSLGAAAVLATAPAIALLWGSERSGWLFLAIAAGGAALSIAFAPADPWPGAEPWIADRRSAWVVVPLAAGLLVLARSWQNAQGEWREDVVASHAVLAASEARFKAYVENAHDVTAELDGDGQILFVSASRDGQYSLPVADLLGTDAAKYLHPDDSKAGSRAFEKAARGHPNVSEPIRYSGPRGGWRWLRVAVSAYRTSLGELRFVAQARDETALQEAQADRDRLVAELEQALARIETLRGRIAFCASCKDVKNEHGVWVPIDDYLASHSLAELSHGICPRCVAEKTA